MVKTEEIMEVVGQLLRSRINDISSFFPNEESCSDSVMVQAKHLDKIYYSFPSEYTPQRYIHSRLGHITVNPQDEDTTDALINTYVTLEESGRDPTVVNYSPQSIDDFIEELIDIAEEESKYSHRHEARVIVLHGPRGCGKTFFLNHVLAKNSSQFDKRSILWIRVNLAANFGGSANLRHWIYAQCTKVILRYYDKESDYYDNTKITNIPLREHLENFVTTSQRNPEVQARQLVSIQQLCQVYQKTKRDEPISPSLIPLILARESFYFALEQGYRIIVALDGLDCLESTFQHRKRFTDLYQQAIELAHSFDPFKAALLLVTRTNTLNTMPETREAYSFTRIADDFKELKPVDINSILNARKLYISQHIKTVSQKRGWENDNYGDHIDSFFAFLQEKEATISRINILNSFGSNLRAQVQSIQMAYFDYLHHERERPYLLVESLVKAGRYYPPRHYYYEVDRDSFTRYLGNNSLFDSHLLPSIFTFPCIERGVASHSSLMHHNPNNVLLPMRILQILEAHESRLKDERVPATRLVVQELVDMIEAVFGYHRDLILLVIEELEQFEFISLSSTNFPVPTLMKSMEVHVTGKLKYLLDTLLYEIAYLNLAAMRISIASEYLTRKVPIISANTINLIDVPPPYGPSSPEERKDVLLSWIFSKIVNSIALCRILTYFNEKQKEESQPHINRLRPRHLKTLQIAQRGLADRESGMFGFSGLMRARLEKQIHNIINSLDDYGKNWIYQRVLAYNKYWQ